MAGFPTARAARLAIMKGMARVLFVALSLLTSLGAASRFTIDPKSSVALYRVEETFLGTAVGRTSGVSGFVDFDPARPSGATVGPIEVNVQLLNSGIPLRDSSLRREYLQSARFPIARFVVRDISGLPNVYANGTPMALELTGDLTVRDVTRRVTFAATVTVNGNVMTGSARANVRMTDFGITPPVLLFVRASNDVRLELNFTARR